MSTRGSYRSLVRVTGPGLLILAFLARLPAAMAPLGMIMLVSSVTHSFAQAGAVTAALGVGAAAGGPVVGWLTDRYGQRPVGLVAALVNAIALAIAVWVIVAGAGLLAAVPLAAVVGMTTPQVGPLIRVRWAALLSRRGRADLVPTAMAYEGAADEASFVAGPALVGALSLLGKPALPLLVAVALAIVAAIPFALHHTAERATRPTADRAGRPTRTPGMLPLGVLAVLITAMAAVGVVFGATQTGITALAESVGREGIAGLIYAILGVGSALAGLATAWLPARFSLGRRFPAFAIALFVGSLGLLAVRSLGLAVVAMVILGVTVSPLLICVYALAGRLAPVGRAGMVMTLLASGTVGGVAVGAGVAGPVAQAYGYPAALAVPAVAGLLAVLVAVFGGGRVRAALTPTVVGSMPARVPEPVLAG